MDVSADRPRRVAQRWLGRYLYTSIALFALGVAVGWGLIANVSPTALEGLADPRLPFPTRLTVGTILLNNLLALGVLLAGLVTFAIPTAASLLFNGLVVGFVLGAPDGAPLVVRLALIVPHGALELPAFWLAGAVAIRVTHRLVRYLRGRDEEVLTPTELYETAVLIAIAVALIVMAAVIEATVTIDIAERLTGREISRP